MYICQEKILEESVTDRVSTMMKVSVICGTKFLFLMNQKSVIIK
nr:MAG TPA: adenylosuccinate synthetase [Caudoviricetes sp.]